MILFQYAVFTGAMFAEAKLDDCNKIVLKFTINYWNATWKFYFYPKNSSTLTILLGRKSTNSRAVYEKWQDLHGH